MRPSGSIVDIVRPSLRGFVLRGLLSGGYAGNSSSIVVRREALLHVGGYDQSIFFVKTPTCYSDWRASTNLISPTIFWLM